MTLAERWCRWFGHKEPFVVDRPWAKGGYFPFGVARTKRQRRTHCARCKKGFIEWEGLR